MSGSAGDPLAGRAVLVTRPAERAEGLVARIVAAGGRALRMPVIEIVPRALEWQPRPWTYAAALFVSPAAVGHGVPALGLTPGSAPPLGAVGPATAQALQQSGFRVGIGPGASGDSEGLLEDPALARERIAGRAVLIVRGEGGRERLASELVERGAQVDYAEVYRRARPSRYDPEVVGACELVTATSTEGLRNLLAMVTEAEAARLRGLPLAASGERIAAAARELGFGGPVVSAREPADEALVQALRQCAEQTGRPLTPPRGDGPIA